MIDLVYPEQVAGLAWWPVAVVIVALLVLNIVNNRVAPQTHYLLWSFGGSVMLLALGLLDGNSWTDMGLGLQYLLPGLVWAGICIGVVTAVYLVGSAFPRTRAAFHDERMSDLSGGRLMFQALVEVPFGTVLLEEIAFRAVLFSMLTRRYGLVTGVVVSSLLFGLWHILPSIGTHEQNPALGSVVGEGRRGNILAVALSVLTTTIAGVLFAGLRLVSGSVLAPMGLHWATNGLGYAFSWLLIRERDRRRARHRAQARARLDERKRSGEPGDREPGDREPDGSGPVE
jgi:membrane protease YdiL (CAAX protease family)